MAKIVWEERDRLIDLLEMGYKNVNQFGYTNKDANDFLRLVKKRAAEILERVFEFDD